jgi:hypothetical protein
LEFRLESREALHPHEETIPAQLDALTQDLLRTEVQRDPVLVEREAGVVLDGMHRLAALDRLGAARVLTCSFDYRDAAIRVERWFRHLHNVPADFVTRLEKELLLQPASLSTAMQAVERGESSLAVIGAKRSFLGGAGTLPVGEAYGMLRKVDTLASEFHLDVEFMPDLHGAVPVRNSSSLAVVMRPLRKEDVVRCALEGQLLPPKSTRHVFPIRPLGLNLPLRVLRDPAGGTELLQHAVRQYHRLPGATRYGGRKYAEPLVVFG